MLSAWTVKRISEQNQFVNFERRPIRKLRSSPAAVLVFFPASARARLISTNFRQRTPYRQIDRHSSCTIAVAVHRDPGHRWLRLTRPGRRICGRRRRCILAEQKLRKRCQKVLERLKVGCAAEKIVQHFV